MSIEKDDTILRVRTVPEFMPHVPTPKQYTFLMLDCLKEVLYGGAAGGGKSDALLMAAVQYVDIPGYSALILRRSYADLAMPGALMDRSKKWWMGTRASWSEKDKTWTFPTSDSANPARITFGYLAREKDHYQFQSAEFQFIGFDELTQFEQSQYRFLFSRLRRLEGVDVPLRMRSASNPGNVGHQWVKDRFVDLDKLKCGEAVIFKNGRVFIPAKLADNPYLDRVAYVRTLNELDPVTREQLLRGDWSARGTGGYFKREWFGYADRVPLRAVAVRFWDTAATVPSRNNPDPDFTVGIRMWHHKGKFYVDRMSRFRKTPHGVDEEMRAAAKRDGEDVAIRIEQEPGASGKKAIHHYRNTVLRGYDVVGRRYDQRKQRRAGPVSSAAEEGLIYLVDTDRWDVDAFFDELEGFDAIKHDDIVDALSGAFLELTKYGVVREGEGLEYVAY